MIHLSGIFKAIVMGIIFGMIAFCASTLLSLPAYSAEAVLPPSIPGLEWLGVVIGFLQGIPSVAPITFKIFTIVGTVGSVLTALSMVVQTILAIPEIALRYSGAHALADKIKAISDKVLPILKYLSFFNVQKKA